MSLLRVRGGGRALALTISLLFAGGGLLGPPASAENNRTPPAPSAAAVDRAVQAAVNWLRDQRNERGHWERIEAPQDVHWAGDTALACLALLYAGVDPRRETWLSESLDWLARQKLNGAYACATRAHALAILPGFKHRAALRGDLQWLLDAAYSPASRIPGAFDYTPPAPNALSGRWDNSCTQFGVLGVWMSAEAGLEVPAWFWSAAGGHWRRTQNNDGGWEYTAAETGAKPQSTGSMTAAGVASLFVVLDQHGATGGEAQGPSVRAIENGLEWLARNFALDNPRGSRSWKYYYLYGIERAGRASGYKYFGQRDWFREGAAALLEWQRPDGSWEATGGPMTPQRNTAFALMFLCHGRAPLLFNKLQRPGETDERLRDVAGLARYASNSLERLLNWQIVPLSGPVEDLFDAPVLYLHGRSRIEFDDVEVARLREYMQRGGLLFAAAAQGGDAFLASCQALAERAFPDLTLAPLPPDHPLFDGSVAFKIEHPPNVIGLHNGQRLLMLICARDLAASWVRFPAVGKLEADFQFGLNVYAYATDKTTPRTRLESPTLPLEDRRPERTIEIARVKYDGAWDIEPLGWTRLARYLNNEASTRLLVTSGVALDDAALRRFRVAHLTGTRAFRLSPAERDGLRRYLGGGGTLLADAALAAPEFIESLERELRETLDESPRTIDADSFLITGAGLVDGVDASKAGYRRAALLAAGGRVGPVLRAVGTKRRFSVIYTPLDISVGLLGTNVYNLRGYDVVGGLSVFRNLILYAGLNSAEKSGLHRGPE